MGEEAWLVTSGRAARPVGSARRVRSRACGAARGVGSPVLVVDPEAAGARR